MPTPEELAALQYLPSLDWNAVGDLGRQADKQNVLAANPGMTDAEYQQIQDFSKQMVQSGGAPAMFGADNVNKTPAVQQARAQLDREAQVDATDARFGTDLSWLDPAFRYDPTLLGQSAGSQAYADPAAIAAQNSAMQQAQQFANQNLQFKGDAQQQAMLQQLLGVKAPQFAGAGDQRNVLNAAMGLTNNSGPNALKFDTSGRQGEQYGNLQGIIAGGGANAIEMARRQAARADSESWLRGQREADMADYAERGLTGSGMELLNLSADRQAAAQRNSAADLQTAAALEERRLGAINSAAGLATNMRGQTIDEQGLLNNRATAGLGAASSLVNNMRSSDIQEQLGLNTAQLTQAKYGADLASDMRTQTANEQVANQQAKQAGLNTLASTSTSARGQSAQESQYRATAADDFAVKNQAAIDKSKQDNQRVLIDGYTQMMNDRVQTHNLMAQLRVRGAEGLMGFDQVENTNAHRAGADLGSSDASTFNNAQTNFNNTLTGAGTAANANTAAAQQGYNTIYPQMGSVEGQAAETVVNMGVGAAGGAGGGGGSLPAAGATNLSMPTGGSNPFGVGVGGGGGGNPYGVGVGGGSNSGTYGAGLGGGQLQLQSSFLPANYKLDDMNK